MYGDCCLLLYLNMSTYEYYTGAAGRTYRVVPYDPSLVVASFVASLSRSCCWADHRPTVRLSRVWLLLLLCHFFWSFVAFFAFSLAPLLYPRLYLTVCIQLNSACEDCCCCCTCDHLPGLLLLSVPMTCSSPSWLLLLLFIVNRLLIVYHAVLLIRHSYHPAHAFVWWAQCTCLKYSSCTCEDQFHFYFVFRFFFLFSAQTCLRAPIITTVVVRLFAPDRDSCVLASRFRLPLVLLQWSILQFSLRIRIVAAYFFI